ncbi:hypothetical protein FE257_003930 [Aspergillus nanangensis]|uniref:Zn(2)-C6 fungal-type domain-containing protein n=1 Tax=Aspergillus nanangensis TaxID=2582783 RepID=A0AAD4GV94_ASPNN|nr:hypothetical protein FE257_003930 [Aspergillus nanangensis]
MSRRMRTACWTCRRRTIQCDQTSFPCAKCQKAGLECFEKRPLRWVKGVAIRRKMRGRVLGGTPKGSEEHTPPQLKQNRSPLRSAKSLAPNVSPSFALEDPCVHDLDWSSRFYLDYYNLRIAKLFILHDSESNPFRNLLSYAMDHSILQQCIIAVAARHFANTGKSFDHADGTLSPRFVNANLDALHFKQRTITALSLSLSHPESSQKDEIMATILLLIFLDILEAGINGWKYHLRGVEGLVNVSHSLLESGPSTYVNNDPGETVDETRRFVARQFSLISTIGGALSGVESRPELAIGSDDSRRHQESIIRSFLGCPGFLLRAIRYFSNQRHVVTNLYMHDDMSIDEHVQNTRMMLELTVKFDCFEWASDFVQSRRCSTLEIQKLSLLSNAYKNATILYGTRILRGFKTQSETAAPESQALVSGLLDAIESLKHDETLFKCLLWPTFIAGLECHTEVDKTLVVTTLKMLWNLTCCLNVIGASNILHEYWKRNDSDDHSAPAESEFHVIEQGWLLI